MSNGLSLRKMMLRESSYKASDTSLIYIAVAKMPSAAIADSASNIIVFRFRLAAQAKIDDVFSASGRGVSDAPVYRAVVELKTEKFGGKRLMVHFFHRCLISWPTPAIHRLPSAMHCLMVSGRYLMSQTIPSSSSNLTMKNIWKLGFTSF